MRSIQNGLLVLCLAFPGVLGAAIERRAADVQTTNHRREGVVNFPRTLSGVQKRAVHVILADDRHGQVIHVTQDPGEEEEPVEEPADPPAEEEEPVEEEPVEEEPVEEEPVEEEPVEEEPVEEEPVEEEPVEEEPVEEEPVEEEPVEEPPAEEEPVEEPPAEEEPVEEEPVEEAPVEEPPVEEEPPAEGGHDHGTPEEPPAEEEPPVEEEPVEEEPVEEEPVEEEPVEEEPVEEEPVEEEPVEEPPVEEEPVEEEPVEEEPVEEEPVEERPVEEEPVEEPPAEEELVEEPPVEEEPPAPEGPQRPDYPAVTSENVRWEGRGCPADLGDTVLSPALSNAGIMNFGLPDLGAVYSTDNPEDSWADCHISIDIKNIPAGWRLGVDDVQARGHIVLSLGSLARFNSSLWWSESEDTHEISKYWPKFEGNPIDQEYFTDPLFLFQIAEEDRPKYWSTCSADDEPTSGTLNFKFTLSTEVEEDADTLVWVSLAQVDIFTTLHPCE